MTPAEPYDDPMLWVLDRLQALHLSTCEDDVVMIAAEAAAIITGSDVSLAGLTDGKTVTAGGWHSVADGWTGRPLRWEWGHGGPGHVCESGKALVCNELPPGADMLTEAVDVIGLTGFACVPISDDDGMALGFLEVGNKQSAYMPGDIRAMRSIARHAAIRLQALDAVLYGSQMAPSVEPLRDALTRYTELLVPRHAPELAGLEIGLLYRPLADVAQDGQAIPGGGDFADFFSYSPGRLAVLVGDVAGHGPGAVATALTAVGTLRGLSATRWPPNLSEVLADANNALLMQAGDLTRSGATGLAADTRPGSPTPAFFGPESFVTLIVGLLDLERGHALLASAGNPAPYLITTAGAAPLEMPATTPAAATPLFEADAFPTKRVELSPGDALLLFTDGLPDVRDAAGRFYGEVRLKEALDELRGLPAQELVERLLTDAERFGGRPLQDDVALILLRRTATPEGETPNS